MYSEAVAEGGRLSTLRALRHRNYRYLWLGQVGHSASLWMEQVVRPLLILELTHSAMMVGLVVVVRMLPVLTFGLVAGAVADRYDRRRVLMYCQAVALL
ncbi:MAG: MFS transporter, partial [Chloroflexi bacterium]|nr:MFS transporter [Chloroflexota bacterium]